MFVGAQSSVDSKFHDAAYQLLMFAGNLHPGEFQTRFASLIANIVGNLPDDYWQEFIKIKPCGRAGCGCHLTLKKHAVDLFKLLRAEHAEHAEVTLGAA